MNNLFPVAALLIIALIVPHAFAGLPSVPKPIAVLGTVDRVLTKIDLSGDGLPERIEFRADRRTFSIQTGQHVWSADSLEENDRILIWDFDQERRGVEFIHVGYDPARSTASVQVFSSYAYRWVEKEKRYDSNFYLHTRTLATRPAQIDRVLIATEQSVHFWLGRRQRTWQLLRDLQMAIRGGRATDGFFAKNAIKPIGWSDAVRRGAFTLLSYSEDEWKPVSYITGKMGAVNVILLIYMDHKQGLKIAQIKLE